MLAAAPFGGVKSEKKTHKKDKLAAIKNHQM
jgi:hypothetical protein